MQGLHLQDNGQLAVTYIYKCEILLVGFAGGLLCWVNISS